MKITTVSVLCDHCGKKIATDKKRGEWSFDEIFGYYDVTISVSNQIDGEEYTICPDCKKILDNFFKKVD